MSQIELAALYGKPLAELSIYFRDGEGRPYPGALRLTAHALALMPPTTALWSELRQNVIEEPTPGRTPAGLLSRLLRYAHHREPAAIPQIVAPQPLRDTDLVLDGPLLRLRLGAIRLTYKPTEYDCEAAPAFINLYQAARAAAR